MDYKHYRVGRQLVYVSIPGQLKIILALIKCMYRVTLQLDDIHSNQGQVTTLTDCIYVVELNGQPVQKLLPHLVKS